MGFGGAQSMNTVLKNNRNMLSKRKKLSELDLDYSNDSYKKLQDHKQMNAHEFAAFQKEQFKQRKEERRRFYILFSIVMIVVIIVMTYFLYFHDAPPIKPIRMHQ